MPNKLLVCLDKLIWKVDKIAHFCKSLNGKGLGIFSTVILCCTVVAHMGTDALKNVPIIKSVYYDTIVSNFPQFVDFLSVDIGKIVCSIAMLLVCICYLFRKLYRPFATLIAHSTMGHDLSVLHERLKRSFWFIRKYVGAQLPSKDASEDQIISAIYAQDESFFHFQ